MRADHPNLMDLNSYYDSKFFLIKCLKEICDVNQFERLPLIPCPLLTKTLTRKSLQPQCLAGKSIMNYEELTQIMEIICLSLLSWLNH